MLVVIMNERDKRTTRVPDKHLLQRTSDNNLQDFLSTVFQVQRHAGERSAPCAPGDCSGGTAQLTTNTINFDLGLAPLQPCTQKLRDWNGQELNTLKAIGGCIVYSNCTPFENRNRADGIDKKQTF